MVQISVLLLHLPPQKSCRRLDQLLFHFPHPVFRVCVQQNDRAGLDALLDRLGDMPVVLTSKSLRYIRFLRR